jgi:two-component system chemotaxis sensor kinase CheA
VDHGIEAPEVREKAGKPTAGTIRLRAYPTGDSVAVEIRDDGQGLNLEKIRAKALAKGLIEPDRMYADQEIYNLIFHPGFSTAEQVTDVSGRGVGMDVVKKGIEALKGAVEIASEPGKGTTFTMKVPLTLAITDGMVIRVGEERYVVPIANIHVSFRPGPQSITTVVGRGEMVAWRDDLMPIFRLHRLFEIPRAEEDPTRGLLIVVGDTDRRCALLVDEIAGQQQVVAKALGTGLGEIPGVSGGAILGDGRVGLILDTTQLTALARESPN